jgi:hypothetical protein
MSGETSRIETNLLDMSAQLLHSAKRLENLIKTRLSLTTGLDELNPTGRPPMANALLETRERLCEASDTIQCATGAFMDMANIIAPDVKEAKQTPPVGMNRR